MGNVIVIGLREVVTEFIPIKNRQPAKYFQSSGFTRSFLPAPKKSPPAKRDKNMPCKTLAFMSKGFLTVFKKFLLSKAP